MSGIKAFCLVLLLCVANPTWARDAASQSASKPRETPKPLDLMGLGSPAFTNFSARDGLPDAVTVDICTDRDGFVWAASPVGVFRYDGRHWVGSDDPAMAHSVHSLWVDWQGTLWAAFRNEGLAHYDGKRWHVENLASGLPSQQVRRFTETVDASGARTLWALTWDHGLMLRRSGRWQADPDNASLPHSSILSMAQTRTLGGPLRQWVGTGSEGLWYRDTGTQGWRQWHADRLDSAQVEYLLATERNGREELWLSVFGVGLWRLWEDGLQRWSKEDGTLPTNELYDIASTPLPGPLARGDRDIWVSSRSGLLRVHDDHVQAFDRRHGLPSDVIRATYAWRSPSGDDVVWLATEAGVSRTVLGASPWVTASLLGSRSVGVFGVLVEPDGRGDERLWVGASEDGVALYEQGRWQYFNTANGALPTSNVSMLVATDAADGSRTHWVGLRGGDLLRVRENGIDGVSFERQDTPWPAGSGEAPLDILVRQVDGHEERWVGTRQSGIWRWRKDQGKGRWTEFHSPQASGQWRVTRFQQQTDASGRNWIWASTNQGLARFDGRQWMLFGRDAGLPDAELISMRLILDPGGRPILWIGSSSAGIIRVDISDPLHPAVVHDSLPAAADPTAYGALSDSTGRIYICTNNGVQQLTPSLQNPGSYQSRIFTRRDGMVHDECNTNAQFIDAHDRFWTGTLGGLAVFDPHREKRDRQPKPLRITELRIGGKSVAGPGMHIGADVQTLEIDFALLSWTREGESRFRTQLIGYEDTPGEWSEQASRTFNALPPGRYTLRIEARDHAGNLSAPLEVPIVIDAHWWQRPPAYIAGLVALLLLGYAGTQWRTRTLKAQQRVLERRVAERTTELDAANARLLELSYHDALTGLANRRRLLERLEAPPAATPATPTALILVDVDHFKDYNDSLGHPAGDEALRGVARMMKDCAPAEALVARYGGEEFACLLPGTDIADAVALAERMRIAVAGCDIPVPGESRTMHVTISAGVASATLADSNDAHLLMRNADIALYQAKRDGRNTVRSQDATG
ncbi:diguanylate cyclase [Thermomonas sp.]|uniref:diguanylate cyclase domain-containing protein n=1 Tax=Thermomonas sp. TaxID=1971895 RepID=UPI0024882EB4|nr:diguanylate cyclase [Thermomonas sp.]MDI1253096.1 diguanylate cyclase [Thermomonas sp.]